MGLQVFTVKLFAYYSSMSSHAIAVNFSNIHKMQTTASKLSYKTIQKEREQGAKGGDMN